jgi:hypothetical protein
MDGEGMHERKDGAGEAKGRVRLKRAALYCFQPYSRSHPSPYTALPLL